MNKIQQEMKLFHDKIEPILEKNICCQGSVLGYEFYFRSKRLIFMSVVCLRNEDTVRYSEIRRHTDDKQIHLKRMARPPCSKGRCGAA